MKSTYTDPRYTLEISREGVRVETRGHHELKPGWSETDPEGHRHTSLDSFVWTVTGTYWCSSCSDEHEEGEYRCRECGETVDPEWIFIGPDVSYVPGLMEATLTLRDGRVFMLDGDDLTFASWPPTDEWLAKVTAREPYSWTVSSA